MPTPEEQTKNILNSLFRRELDEMPTFSEEMVEHIENEKKRLLEEYEEYMKNKNCEN